MATTIKDEWRAIGVEVGMTSADVKAILPAMENAHIDRALALFEPNYAAFANALRREVGEISQKVLASTLRDLEENGFVSRTVTPVNPPQVEYALTDLGREFLFPVRSLAECS
jgi:DNA-binding MarR family transcriptional regulator